MKARGKEQRDPREPAEAKKATAESLGAPGRLDTDSIEESRAGPREPGIAAKGPGMTVEEIAQVIAGDPEAADRFTDVYGAFLKDLVRRWSMALPPGKRPDEDEIVQELLVAFVTGKRRLLRLWDPQRGTLLAYMRAVARNYYIDLLRRQRREALLPEPLEEMEQKHRLGAALSVGGTAEAPEAEAALFRQQAIGFLKEQCTPEEWKLVWDLEAEEKSVGEMAEQLGVSAMALYQRKHRLYERLHEAFKKYLAGWGRSRR
ncbi:MAG TPA: sigma-70 family RNA polymerase sigma factor [Polyangia bacterium]|jgi:RNA polymerase sigma factor (sigma-70 family)|nr:sigma-70 family RNA polymerase sigma factor [Polyangia bacterium]